MGFIILRSWQNVGCSAASVHFPVELGGDKNESLPGTPERICRLLFLLRCFATLMNCYLVRPPIYLSAVVDAVCSGTRAPWQIRGRRCVAWTWKARSSQARVCPQRECRTFFLHVGCTPDLRTGTREGERRRWHLPCAPWFCKSGGTQSLLLLLERCRC